jgi:DNA-binding GntR family transcriptional regulator
MPMPDGVSPIVRPLINREACARLRQWILDGILRPGEVLRDQVLAEQLGVSRTPIREALLCLEAEGLVETSRNRWTRVTEISIRTAEEIYPILGALEEAALRMQASQLGAALVSGLQRANRKLARAISRKACAAAVEADSEFHGLIVAGTGNSELISTMRGLARKLQRVELAYFSRPLAARASVSEHERVISAVELGDLDGAIVASAANWRNSLHRVRNEATEHTPSRRA